LFHSGLAGFQLTKQLDHEKEVTKQQNTGCLPDRQKTFYFERAEVVRAL